MFKKGSYRSLRWLTVVFVGLILCLSASGKAGAAEIKTPGKVVVTQVSASVNPESFSGDCPHSFEFTGRISAKGFGKVVYQWMTSDGLMTVPKTTYFERSGSKIVKFSKELNSSGSFSATLQILQPNRLTSNRATCTLTCIPRVAAPSYRISGNVNGGSEGNKLHDRKVRVLLIHGGRTFLSRELTLDSSGQGDYEFGGPFLRAGDYTLRVEKVDSDPATAPPLNVCFRGTTPAVRNVTLDAAHPVASGQDFVINFVIAWDRGLCW
jgi:hypothetical protein